MKGSSMNASLIEENFRIQKLKSLELRTETISDRLAKLARLKEVLLRRENEVIAAHYSDFKKPASETLLTEIFPVYEEIAQFQKKLKCWSRPKSVGNPILLLGSKSQIYFEPKGCILIIAPWNYPFNLSLVPLVGAIGAGNTVILKPSELTPNVSRLIKEIISESFAPEIALVVEGGVETSQKLLELEFDHIFFTGSTNVGKLVMQAAAKNLTPVTLELGGKSPAIVCPSADLKTSAEKLIWGKSVNSGQTCVSPDYVYVHNQIWDAFIDSCKLAVTKLHEGHERAQIITDKHFQRLLKLKNDALQGGAKLLLETDSKNNRDLSPVLLELQESPSALAIMNEEIFGPLLPMIRYTSDQEIINRINSEAKPLALYIFSQDKTEVEFLLKAISAGGVAINNTLLHLGNHNLPFGGIGASGMGQYHGHFSFLEFSHQKAVLKHRLFHRILKYFYPPYTMASQGLLGRIVRLMPKL